MNTKGQVWLNGKLVPWETATVPLLSHGFSRGSAIIEVFGIHLGPDGPAAFRMDMHLERLMRSAQLLGMKMAYSSEEIASAVGETVIANNMGRGLIKILAYWGEESVISLSWSRNLIWPYSLFQTVRNWAWTRENPCQLAFPNGEKLILKRCRLWRSAVPIISMVTWRERTPPTAVSTWGC